MKLEEPALLAVCHAVSAGYANMARRADGIQNAAGLLEALCTLHDKAPADTYCCSKQLRTLRAAIKQVEGMEGLGGKSTAQLKRLRNLLGMGSREGAEEVQGAEAKSASSKAKVKRKREKEAASGVKEEKKSPKKKTKSAQSQE